MAGHQVLLGCYKALAIRSIYKIDTTYVYAGYYPFDL